MTPERVLTLDDTVKLAENNSQALLSLREDENIAFQRVREAESLFFPKLDLNANWNKFRVEGDRPMLLQSAMGSTLITSSPRENFYTTRANVFQAIYQGGRIRNTWRQARISYERAKSANQAARVEVSALAKQAFYDLLLAQEKRKQYEEALKRLDFYGQRAPVATLEGIRVERSWTDLRKELISARQTEEQARLTYLRALNIELNTHVSLKGELHTQPLDLDLQKMLAWASQYRAELRETEYQEELDALGVSLSLAERTPTIGFGASYERAGFDERLETSNWAGTLNINIPLSVSNLFYGWAKVRERKAQYRQATLKHAETQDRIEMQVRQAFADYQFWQSELLPREREFKRADGVVSSLRQRNSSGLERLEGEHLLLDARLAYQEAIHGHLVAFSVLERAVGHELTGDY